MSVFVKLLPHSMQSSLCVCLTPYTAFAYISFNSHPSSTTDIFRNSTQTRLSGGTCKGKRCAVIGRVRHRVCHCADLIGSRSSCVSNGDVSTCPHSRPP
ncbi:hypothetical protein BU24DRAFT_169991 [Aaosphaeria arxii CBS 175.79]|uniref:Uncharacterized protein n=1 Tax=Aaosphaeria arxii CBS 175.79 TaxID=1450172 RepID=A0A6A5XZI3_9PLEO|nr:uncharacterized protein BU24DRAFT_169991 [Aaosphaeria arxii CBS 175.79]KAF2018389.1 hypothetical protein BU24DRAFT_169991 [Aaosphaeria arxii CBS 175.79]